jgi:gluconolactonase
MLTARTCARRVASLHCLSAAIASVTAVAATVACSSDTVARTAGTGGDNGGAVGTVGSGGTTGAGGITNGSGGSAGTSTGQGGSSGAPDSGGTRLPDAGGDANTGGNDASVGPGRYVCPPGPFGDPLPSPATPTRLAGVPPSDAFNMQNNTFGILEGPVWIGDSLYVSEIGQGSAPPPSRILKVTATGAVSIAVADSGSNGLAVDVNGNLVGAVHKDGSISQFDLATGGATPLATGINGIRFDAPNDLVIRSDGNVYFSDTDFQAPQPAPQPQTRLYRVAAGTHVVSVLDATRNQPNGVTLSLDENTLFVAWPAGIYKYALAQDGSAGTGVLVTSSVGSGDGMTVDCAGNLYVATNTDIVVLNPAGTEIHRLTFSGVQSVTNAAFGGPDHKTLYVTALGSQMQKGLFKVDFAIPGQPD